MFLYSYSIFIDFNENILNISNLFIYVDVF